MKYIQRKGGKAVDTWKLKGLVECPVCEMVYSASEWSEHRWKELNRRKVTQRPVLKSEDGRYRCVVPGCEWGGSLCHTHLKTHLMKHTLQELSLGPYSPEVSESHYIFINSFIDTTQQEDVENETDY